MASRCVARKKAAAFGVRTHRSMRVFIDRSHASIDRSHASINVRDRDTRAMRAPSSCHAIARDTRSIARIDR